MPRDDGLGDTRPLVDRELIAQSVAALAKEPALLELLQRELAATLRLNQEPVRPATAIQIGGGVQATNLVMGTANVQTLVSDLRSSLLRLPEREAIELLRRSAPSAALLERAEALGLSSASFAAFERNLHPHRVDFEPAAFRSRLAALEQTVGVVELQGLKIGTCFLIAPELVATCYHVVASCFEQPELAKQVRIRFNYGDSGELDAPNSDYALAPEWCARHVPSGSEASAEIAGGRLDYAILRLTPLMGSGAAAAPRPSIPLSSARQPRAGDPLLILQHPRGQRLKLSFGTVLGFDATGDRVRYDTNTDVGSSGAPCFNEGLEFVAMHQMAEPSRPGERLAKYNQGVVATRLLEDS
jgi:hypothetical protein